MAGDGSLETIWSISSDEVPVTDSVRLDGFSRPNLGWLRLHWAFAGPNVSPTAGDVREKRGRWDLKIQEKLKRFVNSDRLKPALT